MDDLVDKLDENATQSFRIVSTSHSRITEYRRQLKIKAVQAAKEKGVYLSEALGEKIGEGSQVHYHQPGPKAEPFFYGAVYCLSSPGADAAGNIFGHRCGWRFIAQFGRC